MKRINEKCPNCGQPDVEGLSGMAGGGFVAEGGAMPELFPMPFLFICEDCGHQWQRDTPDREDKR